MTCIENIYTVVSNINPICDLTVVHQPPNARINSRPVWSVRISGRGQVVTNQVSVDKNNNIVVAGVYQGDLGTPINFYNVDDTIGKSVSASGKNDNFVAKYSNNGYLIWLNIVVSTCLNPKILVSIDHHNNIFIAGCYQTDKIILNKNFILFAPPGTATFLIKYESDGKLVWANRIVASSVAAVNSITVNESNDLFVTGYYSGTNFDNETDFAVKFFNIRQQVVSTLPETVGDDSFVAKYNTHGGVQWVTRFAANNLTTYSKNIATDIVCFNDRVIVVGIYQANPLIFYNSPNGFGFTTISLVNNNDYNIFVANYDTSGKIIWAKHIRGPIKDEEPNVTVDQYGDITVTGLSDGPIVSELTEIQAGRRIRNNIFLLKYSSNGSPKRQQYITGHSITNQSIITDHIDNKILIGSYSGRTITFHEKNNSSGPTMTNNGETSSYLAKYNTSGQIIWSAKQSGLDTTINTGLAVDSNDNIIISGTYQSNILNLYSSSGIPIKKQVNIGNVDGFITLYINYSQTLNLMPSLMPIASKRIVLESSCDAHTLVLSQPNTLVDSNGFPASGFYLMHPRSSILLRWQDNRWIVQEQENSVIIY